MKQLLLVLLCVMGLGATATAAEIPIRDFFEHAEVANMKISPDGSHVAFTYEAGTEVRLAVMNLASKKITASFEFGDQMHVLGFAWGNNERVLMQVGKVTGNLDNMGRPAHLYAANIDGKKRQQIFEMQRSSFNIISLLPDDDRHILIAKRHFTDTSVRAHLLDIYTGDLKYLADQPDADNIYRLMADNSGAVRIGLEFVEGDTIDDGQVILHVKSTNDGNGGKWKKVALSSKRKSPTLDPVGFSSDNDKAYFVSNYDSKEGGLTGLFEYSFSTNTVRLVERDKVVDVYEPSGIGGVMTINGHDGGLLGVTYMPGKLEYSFLPDTGKDSVFIKSLVNAFNGQIVDVTSFTADGTKAIAHVSSDKNPGEFYLFDVQSMKAKFLASRLPKLDTKSLASVAPVEFDARDGLKIHGYLTLPNNSSGKNLPLVMNIHGGPFGIRDDWGFHSDSQFLANRGYAVLQVNYRGSGGYGDDFHRAGWRQWGRKMQDDVTDATQWAIKQGIADPNRVCIYGGSYGGYATLWGVIKEPDLYKCAVGYVGVYDMLKFFNGDGSDASRGDKMDEWIALHIGDTEAELREISPAQHVDRIKADLLIAHGKNDVRVTMPHFDSLKASLDKIGKKFDWMVKPEGHGYYQLENRVALYGEMEKFLKKNIGEGAKQ
ncbi:S9 family peptidase [Permianibacter sp. IMCC34836]|uniref:alpha/beta hydrolase family protein n=1 Tax=Permianibacter fluminis TaxID=2738515 RepID=UPI001551B9C3|nr:S9 family peptidase [Permianibacter fluminis]NQD38600.1 S9 family peptidase [Permianibacter fluminis]